MSTLKPIVVAPMDTTYTLRKRARNLLTELIFSGKLAPGHRINESLLARELHVSRAPIREALHQLKGQGLIMNVPWRGMFVVNLSEEDIQKINSARIVLEAEALRLAQIRLSPRTEKKLARLVESMKRSKNWLITKQLDYEFHSTLWNLAGNEYLENLLTSLTAPVFAHLQLSMVRRRKRTVIPSHLSLLEFVRGRTSESAEEVMIRHLSDGFRGDPAEFSSFAQKAREELGNVPQQTRKKRAA